MRKRIWILATVVIVAGAAGFYLWGPSKAPEGQQPLTRLSSANFIEFEAAFDAAADGPRVVIQVSPT
ncbi:MAG: hypothetical protein WAM91_15315 [Candidatus Acidiferrales bacterium]